MSVSSPTPDTAPSSRLTINFSLTGLIWAGLDLYALGMAAYIGLHALFGTRWWPVAFLANFAHWLLLPLFLLLPLTLWRKRWPTAFFSIVGVIGFLFSYGALFLPPMTPVHATANGDTAHDNGRSLTVLTYNIQNTMVPPDRLIAILDEIDADIVGITELGSRQSEALEANAVYPHQVLSGLGIPGLGLLSRYPILDHDIFYLDTHALPHLKAVLDVDGVPLTVVLAHPPPPDINRSGYIVAPGVDAEFTALAALVAAGQPGILLGDLNTSDQSDNYRLLIDAGLIDSFRAAGWGFGVTWPARKVRGKIPLPVLVRIDYIIHTPDLQTVAVWTGPAGGSDHLPVIAELRWP